MPEPMTKTQLAEIAARAEAATRGPWGIYDEVSGRMDIAADLKETGYGYSCRRGIAQVDEEPVDNDPEHADWDETADLAQCIADALFIANAREDVPALLAEVERLREFERRVTEEVEEFEDAANDDPETPAVARHMIRLLRMAMADATEAVSS